MIKIQKLAKTYMGGTIGLISILFATNAYAISCSSNLSSAITDCQKVFEKETLYVNSPESQKFKKGLKFHIVVKGKLHLFSIRHAIVQWVVAQKFENSKTKIDEIVLKNAIKHISLQPFPVKTETETKNVLTVHVSKNTLNEIVEQINKRLKTKEVFYKIDKISIVGAKPNVNDFVANHLNIKEGYADSTSVSDNMYQIGQIPGIERVDGLFTEDVEDEKNKDLIVQVEETPQFSGSSLEIDNYGYASTGAVVLNANGNVNNAGVVGGLFSVSASTSFGGMESGTISYSLPITLKTRTGIDINAMDYSLGKGITPWGNAANISQLEALGVSGSNYSGDIWFSQSPYLEPEGKITLKETAFIKEYQDTYSSTSQNDRSILGGTIDLSANKTIKKWNLSFDVADTEYQLTEGAGSDPNNPFFNDSRGLQNYLNGNASLVYSFNPIWYISLSSMDQQYIGAGVLDPMLQATLGGPSNVMAMATASMFGNDSYIGTLTVTHNDFEKIGDFATSAFFDVGQVTGINTSYYAMGPGLEEMLNAHEFFIKGDIAVPVGELPRSVLGQSVTAVVGGNIGQGQIPMQLWLSAGLRY